MRNFPIGKNGSWKSVGGWREPVGRMRSQMSIDEDIQEKYSAGGDHRQYEPPQKGQRLSSFFMCGDALNERVKRIENEEVNDGGGDVRRRLRKKAKDRVPDQSR